MNNKVLVAMSGGVDSSVAVLLLKEAGYDVIGITLRMFTMGKNGLPPDNFGITEKKDDIKDAATVAEALGIKHKVLDFTEYFHKDVILPFVNEYLQGRTPNPCINCNRYVKLGMLYKAAAKLGCDYVATGHYANVEKSAKTGRWLLKKGRDRRKDQSYMLYNLSQEQLEHTLFPLGNLDKDQIRTLAADAKLPIAHKADSQDICFVPDGDYARIISAISHRGNKPGDFVLTDGTFLGKHKGIIHYTIGQRKGLGIAYEHPLFVVKKDAENNKIILGSKEELYNSYIFAEDCNLISIKELTGTMDVMIKARYSQSDVPGTIEPCSDSTMTEDGRISRLKVRFKDPARALTPGQAIVFYGMNDENDLVVGGGTAGDSEYM